jgi:hypothetical protein
MDVRLGGAGDQDFPELSLGALIQAAPSRSGDVTHEQLNEMRGKTIRVVLTKGSDWSDPTAAFNLSIVEE